ncbi:hypothetical protein QSV08_07620 [Maribacter sp. BPC-D8]|uniref:hypothetical protein n=1 Tax=Maribacter sp. BPC-D8 TaxID=3053613 RepID=UPI002B45FF6D|nr:hypothetical protein [Maribacter sp. BPC-D8]WRI31112.1 hypothetical protein QSV08_07620 [Maribacter sp. BPC-D8]
MNITEEGNLNFDTGVISKEQTSDDICKILGSPNSQDDFNNGWCTITYKGLESTNEKLNITFRFKNRALKQIDFTPRYNQNSDTQGWGNWSKKKELELKETYDVWLNSKIGPKRIYEWGSIASVYDPKSGSSSIVIIYK